MATDNLQRFYIWKYEEALRDYNRDSFNVAEEKCIQLIAEFCCPRIVQVQAWQLRSLCSDDYWTAKSHLTSALELLQSLNNNEDKLVQEVTSHTNSMLDDLEAMWAAYWRGRGEQAPTEEPNLGDEEIDDEGVVYVAVEDAADEDAQMTEDATLPDVETAHLDLQNLNLNGTDRKRESSRDPSSFAPIPPSSGVPDVFSTPPSTPPPHSRSPTTEE